MKILRFILLCLMVFMLGLDGQAQNLQNVSADHIQELLAMNNSYQLGRFEETIELGKELEEEVTDNNSKFIVFQLMSLSYLYMDQEDLAREYASKLLIVAPNYSGENEGPRFNAIIRSLKRGVVTIETASSQAEDISESPVPIVLITEEMIEHSSAQTVGELLKLYVPSISEISGAEDNIAMRGIYGFSQEDVLFLLNGKRLNSGAGNAEAPDFRTTLDKVKRIEVLRGPASSLYGNVALSAVVNIITRKGAELDGSQGALHVGSFNTYGGSFLTGLGGVDHDMMAWASIYTSKGQKDDKNRYRGGYNKKPAYDFGMRGQWKDITIQFSMQHSKLVPHTNVVQMFQDYTYDLYGKVHSNAPGTSRTAIRGSISYDKTWGNKFFTGQFYADSESTSFYNIMGDEIRQDVAELMLRELGFGDLNPMCQGVWQDLEWDDYTLGGSLQGGINYGDQKGQYGTLLAGVQAEFFSVTSGSFTMGDFYGNEPVFTFNNFLLQQNERTYSAFAQLKHHFSDKFIGNVGLRYDKKFRLLDTRASNLSPRMALIWLPRKNMNIRLAYSHSFVDAPYLYRSSTFPLFGGGPYMTPQEMDSYQMDVEYSLFKGKITAETNFFYNKATDLVFYSVTNMLDKSTGETSNYTMVNSGRVDMLGAEQIIKFQTPKIRINLNLSYQYPSKVEGYATPENTLHTICNLPRFMGNLNAAYQVMNLDELGDLWIHSDVKFRGSQWLLTNNLIAIMVINNPRTLVEHQGSYYAMDFGADWRWKKFKFSLDVRNLMNRDYVVGGILRNGIPQQGRSLIGKIQYNF